MGSGRTCVTFIHIRNRHVGDEDSTITRWVRAGQEQKARQWESERESKLRERKIERDWGAGE